MIKRRLGFAGILLAGLILVLYLTGGGKIFGRLGVSRCDKLWKESEEVMVEGEVYQKTRKDGTPYFTQVPSFCIFFTLSYRFGATTT